MMYTFRAMNSTIHLDSEKGQEDIQRLFRTMEQCASRFRMDNELAYINRAALYRPIYISKLMYDLLACAIDVAKKTDFVIHPFVGKAMCALGYDRSFSEKSGVSKQETEGFTQSPVELLGERWIIKTKPFQLDFGGFGKGFAADKAKHILQQQGVSKAMVNAGGDVSLIGRYTVGIAHPLQVNRDIAIIEVEHMSVATSGVGHRSWIEGESMRHHFVDGRTGRMAENGALQATVVAKTTVEAEVIAKLFCILSYNEAIHLVRAKFPHCAFFVYRRNEQLYVGGDVHNYLHHWTVAA
ncbi:FAD:protein FMN transferase [Microbacteriaceae bacterium 4G12]